MNHTDIMKKTVLAIAAVAATCGAASASNFSYSYAGIGYINTNFDDDIVINGAAHSGVAGLTLEGSWQATDHFALGVMSTTQTSSGSGTEITISGVGFWGKGILPVGDSTDFNLRLGWLRGEAEVCVTGFCAKGSDNGFAIGTGVRHWMTSSVEINASITHVSLDDHTDDGTSVSAGIAFLFAGHHGLRINAVTANDTSAIGIGYRYTF